MDVSETARRREDAVVAAMDDIRRIEAVLGVTRAGVEAIRDRLIELSSQRDLFPLDDFPAPGDDADETSYMYRLAQDDDDRFALYAQASHGHVETPPHDHTTWAVVVGHAGNELNRFYERSDDGVRQMGEHMVEAGTGVAIPTASPRSTPSPTRASRTRSHGCWAATPATWACSTWHRRCTG